jgi:hypothetical protein
MSKIFDRSKFREPVDARGNQMAMGKYDDLCSYVREQTKADGVVVIVVGGDKGHGFAVQGNLETTWMLPDILELAAKRMRRDTKKTSSQS